MGESPRAMNICVMGLWHLGTVTAACLASAGHRVQGLDYDHATVDLLRKGRPPLFEPGLEELVRRGLDEGRLEFTTDASAVGAAEMVWIAYDTPVDDDDRADVDFVVERAASIFPHLAEGTLVLISSQLPVGSTRRLESMYASRYPGIHVTFGYSPENLRLGKAIEAFTRPDRVVAGVRSPPDREKMSAVLKPFTERIEWMSVESAEMTKHALNAFLATSVAFANELAVLCEHVGADAKEVERGLKTEPRIGPKAYLSPGAAFAGGTLARDIAFLAQTGASFHQPVHLLNAVKASNDHHKLWTRDKLRSLVGEMRGRTIAVLGLTYKPGTDTLRRSGAIELCRWMAGEGALVRAHDPAIHALPDDLSRLMEIFPSPQEALRGASALVVATEWPVFLSIEADAVVTGMYDATVIDPTRFLVRALGNDPRVRYVTVGKSTP